jgi:hypothetical protein
MGWVMRECRDEVRLGMMRLLSPCWSRVRGRPSRSPVRGRVKEVCAVREGAISTAFCNSGWPAGGYLLAGVLRVGGGKARGGRVSRYRRRRVVYVNARSISPSVNESLLLLRWRLQVVRHLVEDVCVRQERRGRTGLVKWKRRPEREQQRRGRRLDGWMLGRERGKRDIETGEGGVVGLDLRLDRGRGARWSVPASGYLPPLLACPAGLLACHPRWIGPERSQKHESARRRA